MQDSFLSLRELLERGCAAAVLGRLEKLEGGVDAACCDELRARAYLMLRRHGLAAVSAERALRAGRDNVEVHAILAGSLWLLGRKDEGQKHLSRCEGPVVKFIASEWAIHEERYHDAERLAREALEQDPYYRLAQIHLLLAKAILGDEEAWREMTLMWEIDHAPDLIYPILEVAVKRGVSDQVLRILDEASAEINEDPGYYEAILAFYSRSGMAGRGLEALERFPEDIKASPLIRRAAGVLWVQMGDFRTAERLLEDAARHEPADWATARYLVRVLRKRFRFHLLPRVAFRYAVANVKLG